MIARIALGMTLVIITGCGTTTLSPSTSLPVRAAAAADPRAQIQAQVKELVGSRIPNATVALSDDAWQELGAREGNRLRFDLITDVRRTGTSGAERVEFYGDVDRQTGKLIPGTLLVVSETEATFRALVPSR